MVTGFSFISNDHLPKHIHVEKAEKTAKFFLDPLSTQKFTATVLREIRILIQQNINLFINSWGGYFN